AQSGDDAFRGLLVSTVSAGSAPCAAGAAAGAAGAARAAAGSAPPNSAAAPASAPPWSSGRRPTRARVRGDHGALGAPGIAPPSHPAAMVGWARPAPGRFGRRATGAFAVDDIVWSGRPAA